MCMSCHHEKRNAQHEANVKALREHREATIKAFIRDYGSGADYEPAAIGGAYDTMAEQFAGILISNTPAKAAKALAAGMLANYMREWIKNSKRITPDKY